MPAFVGTSGWQYKDWQGAFYPRGLPTSQWLAAYAARFSMVEVNNTFYRLPAPRVFARWAEETAPTGLRFVVKVSRYLTHVRRLSRDGSYGRHAMTTWAERLRRLCHEREDVYVAFNNDHAA